MARSTRWPFRVVDKSDVDWNIAFFDYPSQHWFQFAQILHSYIPFPRCPIPGPLKSFRFFCLPSFASFACTQRSGRTRRENKFGAKWKPRIRSGLIPLILELYTSGVVFSRNGMERLYFETEKSANLKFQNQSMSIFLYKENETESNFYREFREHPTILLSQTKT